MTTIEALNNACFLVNGIPKQRGQYEIVLDWDNQLVGIRMVGRDGWVEGCELQPVTNYNGGVYTNVNAFVSFLATIIFL